MTTVCQWSASEVKLRTKAILPSSLPLVKLEVEKIQRWDLSSRISLLEDTSFTRSDAEEMEARTVAREDAMEARTVAREEAMGRNMVGFTLLTVGIGQIVPVLSYFKVNGMKLPWE